VTVVPTDPFGYLKAALADRYTIEREIGHGGTALVYLAQDRKPTRSALGECFS
jgi:hypothetical protein